MPMEDILNNFMHLVSKLIEKNICRFLKNKKPNLYLNYQISQSRYFCHTLYLKKIKFFKNTTKKTFYFKIKVNKIRNKYSQELLKNKKNLY